MADDTRQTLDIPNGTTFEFKDGKLIFGHESDIVIRTNMGGYKFQKIFSKRGNVQVLPPEGVEFDVDEIEAPNGDVFLNGRVKARHTRGKTVHFQEGRLTADLVEAKDEIVFAGRGLNVIHARAPRIVVDPDAEGTCLVIESQNEVGRCKARGGFRSVAEAREALESFRRLAGDRAEPMASATPVAGVAAGPTLAVTAPGGGPRVAPAAAPASAPAASPAPPVASAPVFAAAPIVPADAATLDDANQTFPGLPAQPAATGPDGSPVLPKSSVFRKRT